MYRCADLEFSQREQEKNNKNAFSVSLKNKRFFSHSLSFKIKRTVLIFFFFLNTICSNQFRGTADETVSDPQRCSGVFSLSQYYISQYRIPKLARFRVRERGLLQDSSVKIKSQFSFKLENDL